MLRLPFSPIILTVLAVLCARSNVGLAQTLTSFARPLGGDTVFVQLYADGAVRSSVAGAGDGSTATAGSLGVSVQSRRQQFVAQISVASADDTLRSGFGASILLPASGGGLAAGLVDFRRRNAFKNWGLHAYASASSSTWLVESTDAPERAIGAAIAGLGLSTYREIINQPLDSVNGVAVLLEGGIAYRGLFGDIANSEPDALEARAKTLGTLDEHFFGLELGLTVQVNDVRAGLGFYFFNTDATGFSDGQLVGALSVQGGLMSWLGPKATPK